MHRGAGTVNLVHVYAMKRAALILAACLLPALSACAIRKPASGGEYYAQGQLDFADAEYKAAIENYQNLIDRFPFSPYAEDAEMKIGLAHFKEGDYAEAVAALDDFQRMHPTSKQLDLVTYYIARSYYDQIGREDQDQTKSRQALDRFQEVEQRFPESDFAALAGEYAEVCRDMLARHQMIVGNYYFKRADFRAAESRFAELMQKWPDTPIAPDGLYELGVALEKEGKAYSASQAFAAVEKHYPGSKWASRAHGELNRIHMPIDTEADPLPMVLAESGYGELPKSDANRVVVRQRSGMEVASAAPQSGSESDGLPALGEGDPGGNSVQAYPPPGQLANSAAAPVAMLSAPAAPPAMNPPGDPPAAMPANLFPSGAQPAAPMLHQVSAPAQMVAADQERDPPPPAAGPATLKQIALSANNPPLSVVLSLTGPVQFTQQLQRNPSGAVATVSLKNTIPQTGMQSHVAFDKSIFKDCDITTGGAGTTVTLTTRPVANFTVVPLESPPRLVLSFTPETAAATTQKSAVTN
ncbi:MAG: outer membrane protein assembly factor BamD [Candidatus Binataceae bacterium]